MDCRIFLISRLSDLLSSFFLFSSSFFLFSSAPSFSGVAIFLSSDSLRSSTSSMVAIPAFFLLLRLPISLFLKGSRMSLRGMRLLFTMCLATLFRIRLPKLDRAFERIREVALAKDLNSSCFFRLVLSFSIYLMRSSISFNALYTLYPCVLFSFTQCVGNLWHARTRQYFMRYIPAKMSRKANRKTTNAEVTKMIMFLVRSNLVSWMRTQESITLVPTYCSTKIYFRLYHSFIIEFFCQASSPLVPQERSSTRQKENICRMLTQVGEKQMQEKREVSISTDLRKLQVQRMGKANPTITKRMRARRQIRGMRNCYVLPNGYSVVCQMIEYVLQKSKPKTSSPYMPMRVDAPQQMILNFRSL